ncbi:hypothetical protein MTO96_019413 [Rhipicephalus appendiculatus]
MSQPKETFKTKSLQHRLKVLDGCVNVCACLFAEGTDARERSRRNCRWLYSVALRLPCRSSSPEVLDGSINVGVCLFVEGTDARGRLRGNCRRLYSFFAQDSTYIMASFAEQYFHTDARIARFFCCFFVPNAWRSVAFERSEVVFCSWYSAYVAVIAISAIMLEGYLFSLRVFGRAANAYDFFEKLYITLQVLVGVKVLNNLGFIVFGNRVFVEALRDLKRLERSIGFRFREESSTFWWKRHLQLLTFAAVVLFFGFTRALAVYEVVKETPAPQVLAAMSGAFSLYYGVIESMVVIVERYFCVVLSRYVQFQVDRTRELLCDSGSALQHQRSTRHLATAVDRLRASMASVAKIVRKVDEWLRCAVVVNFVISALVVCIMAYAVVSKHTSAQKLLATTAYSTLTCLSIAYASLSAGDIKEQALKLKAVLDSASVEIFSMTIDEKQLCFTGYGFFTVDRPMMTTFIGLVMTYSLIVVPDRPQVRDTQMSTLDRPTSGIQGQAGKISTGSPDLEATEPFLPLSRLRKRPSRYRSPYRRVASLRSGEIGGLNENDTAFTFPFKSHATCPSSKNRWDGDASAQEAPQLASSTDEGRRRCFHDQMDGTTPSTKSRPPFRPTCRNNPEDLPPLGDYQRFLEEHRRYYDSARKTHEAVVASTTDAASKRHCGCLERSDRASGLGRQWVSSTGRSKAPFAGPTRTEGWPSSDVVFASPRRLLDHSATVLPLAQIHWKPRRGTFSEKTTKTSGVQEVVPADDAQRSGGNKRRGESRAPWTSVLKTKHPSLKYRVWMSRSPGPLEQGTPAR